MNINWEAKKRYVEKRNTENRNTAHGKLTDEQCDAIEKICFVRHELHCSIGAMWGDEGHELWDYLDRESDNYLPYIAATVNLPPIKGLPDPCDMPSADDYFILLGETERQDWEKKAIEINQQKPQRMQHNGWSLWQEDSWEYTDFCDYMSKANNIIEKWLLDIDKQYGTAYCPTGYARLK